jgi:ABC-type spermidine/putrescine transport system permease subunit I
MRNSRVQAAVILGLLVPFLVGETIRAFAWLYLLGTDGVVAGVADSFGVPAPQILGSVPAIALGLLQLYIPLSTLVLLNALRSIPEEFEHAARTLGARPWRLWAAVIVPLARPGMAAAGMITFALATTDYAIPASLGLGNTPFVANTVQNIIFGQGNQYLGAAYSGLFIVAVLLGTVVVGAVIRGRRPRSAP